MVVSFEPLANFFPSFENLIYQIYQNKNQSKCKDRGFGTHTNSKFSLQRHNALFQSKQAGKTTEINTEILDKYLDLTL